MQNLSPLRLAGFLSSFFFIVLKPNIIVYNLF